MFGFLLIDVSLSSFFDKAAYLDPGSGSFILQLILAAVLGGFLIFRSYLKKALDFLVGLFTRNPDEDEQDE